MEEARVCKDGGVKAQNVKAWGESDQVGVLLDR